MAGGSRKIRLWDPLLRGFHWSLAFFVTLSWCLGQFGPAKMTLHFWSGYVIAGLLIFRLICSRISCAGRARSATMPGICSCAGPAIGPAITRWARCR